MNSVPHIERLGYRSYMRIGCVRVCVCVCVCVLAGGYMMDVSRATKITG